jgi:hypothetical protein
VNTTLSQDETRTDDTEQLASLLEQRDGARWKIAARVEKFDLDAVARARRFFGLADWEEPSGAQLLALAEPYETVVEEGNLLTRLGLKRLMDRLAGTASNQALDATHCRIGVGDGTTSAAATDTDLSAASGSSHRQFKLVDSVTVGSGASSGVVTIVATFSTSIANFDWNEWGIDGGTSDGTTVTSEGNTTPGLCNHKVTTLGTKTSSATWVFTVTITITSS